MVTSDNFTIIETDNNKKQYLPLLIMGDESESMIDRYLRHRSLKNIYARAVDFRGNLAPIQSLS